MFSHVLSNCTKEESSFNCVSTTESIWFKVSNVSSATEFVSSCDPIFYKKFADVTYINYLSYNHRKYNCTGYGSIDPFMYLYPEIGKTTKTTITMGRIIISNVMM